MILLEQELVTTTEEMDTQSAPSNGTQVSLNGDDEATDIDTNFSEDESASETSGRSITSLPSTDSSEEGRIYS
jgi:hypothetical protein